MASIDSVGEGRSLRYRLRWRDPDKRQRAKTFKRKRDAEAFRDQLGVDRIQGTYHDPRAGKVLFSEYADKWLASKADIKETTRAAYASQLRNHVLPRWGSMPLEAIEHEDVAEWVAGMAGAGVSPSTIRYAFNAFSQALGLAVRARRIRFNPAEGVKLPKSAPTSHRYLTHEEVARLASHCGRHRPLVLLLATSGLRFGEAASLRRKRVDVLRRRVEIAESVTEVRGKAVWSAPKTWQVREVGVPGFVLDALAPMLEGLAGDDLVFRSPTGKVLRNLNFRREAFDAAVVAAGLEGVTPHDLRHTAASLAINDGATVKEVQTMLGHKSAAMTLDVYSHLFDSGVDNVAARMNSRADVYSMCTEAEIVPLRVGMNNP